MNYLRGKMGPLNGDNRGADNSECMVMMMKKLDQEEIRFFNEKLNGIMIVVKIDLIWDNFAYLFSSTCLNKINIQDKHLKKDVHIYSLSVGFLNFGFFHPSL